MQETQKQELFQGIAKAVGASLQADVVWLYPVRGGRPESPIFQMKRSTPAGTSRLELRGQESQNRPYLQEALAAARPLTAGHLLGLPWQSSRHPWTLPGGLLILPVTLEKRVHVLLVLRYLAPATFSRAEQEMFEGTLTLVKHLLTLRSQSQKNQRQRQQLSLLYQITLLCHQRDTPHQLPQRLLHEAAARLQRAMNWHRVEVYQYDGRAGGFVLLGKQSDMPLVLTDEEGVIGEAVRTQHSVLHNPQSQGPLQNLYSTGAEMAVPLVVAKQTQAVLYVEGQQGQTFGLADEQFLTAVARLLSTALEDNFHYMEQQHQLQEATILYRITRAIDHTATLDEILQRILRTIQRTLQAPGLTLTLLNRETGLVEVRAAVGIDAGDSPNYYKVGQGALGKVVQSGKPLRMASTVRFGTGIFIHHQPHALLAVPLRTSEGHTIGTLSLSKPQHSTFSRSEERLLSVTGEQLTTVIENMQLYSDLAAREQHLKEAYNQLQEFTRLKEQMLQNISHELRTPLTLIKGYVELMLEDGDNLSHDQRQNLRVLSRRAQDIVNMVEQMVSLQPLQELKLNRTQVPVSEVLQEMVHIFREQTEGTAISMHLLPPPANLYIYGDLGKIRQLCYNILDNAVKFSPQGGRVTISANGEGDDVHLSFMDEGIGIPKEHLGHIFETFYQVDGSSTRRYGGLGLGLAMVNRIVVAHHGKVWAESELNRGTTIHVLLPKYVPGKS